MKTNKYLLIPIIFLLTSCYIYKPYTEKEVDENAQVNKNSSSVVKSIRTESSSLNAQDKVLKEQGKQELSQEELEAQKRKELEREDQKSQERSNPSNNSSFSRSDGSTGSDSKRGSNKPKKADEPKTTETGIKGKLQPNKYYKITALDHQYKIQVDKWDGDTLISHKIRQPKKVYKHHMNDIQEDAILERRFSKPFSDLFTVGAYASGAAIVLLLIL